MLSRLLISSLAIMLCHAASAGEKLDFDGFVGLGFMTESANNFAAVDGDSNEIVEIGLRASYSLNENIMFTGQIGLRRFGDFATEKKPRIDYAQMNYTTSWWKNSEQVISIGRVKNQLGLYNLARDITLSRPSIILPQSAYLELLRNLFLSSDGIAISSHSYLKTGILSATLSAGQIKIDDNFNHVMLDEFTAGNWSERSSISADLRYATDALIMGVSFHRINPQYNTAPNDRIPFVPIGSNVPAINGKLEMDSYFAFAQYTKNKFEFSAEYSYREVDITGFTPGQSLDRSMEGFYVQTKYLLSTSWSFTARYEDFYRLAENKNGVQTPFFTFPDWYNNARTVSLSTAYNINPHWTLMADVHLVKGSGFLAPFATPTLDSTEKQNWTLSAIQLIYSF
ncbi:hypothetical protein [Glaciecola petra]|uniref:Porin n=1 Tax=Glaciecola petra TaxID=3075602 RepID=A0ABU2ZT48_9ALTE|nr:hypothetical protein [Aestuariibacter sp. P117]MDT0595816.1 hypothetical protein [Aestuariibacter sp. P117]